MKYILMINTADCTGCHACEIACKQEHNLPVGLNWLKIVTDSIKPELKYTVTHCRHCSRPPCQDACSVQAITTRKDGIVLVDQESCTGCSKCIEACPLHMMQFDEKKNVAQKCDLCVNRLDRGLLPACVAACPAHCLYCGDAGWVIRRLQQKKLPA
jgi:Fe-S-cluster-containing dehydrogenase component